MRVVRVEVAVLPVAVGSAPGRAIHGTREGAVRTLVHIGAGRQRLGWGRVQRATGNKKQREHEECRARRGDPRSTSEYRSQKESSLPCHR